MFGIDIPLAINFITFEYEIFGVHDRFTAKVLTFGVHCDERTMIISISRTVFFVQLLCRGYSLSIVSFLQLLCQDYPLSIWQLFYVFQMIFELAHVLLDVQSVCAYRHRVLPTSRVRPKLINPSEIFGQVFKHDFFLDSYGDLSNADNIGSLMARAAVIISCQSPSSIHSPESFCWRNSK
jgi:hypothetical protein